MNTYNDWLAVALTAAEEAGDLVRSQWRQAHTVHNKGFRDIFTETDIATEAIIMKHLRRAFPEHAITSEEAGADAAEANADAAEANANAALVGVRWLIDPIDGTTNFAHDNPNFSISIAAVENGQPVVGVVHDPLRQHIFAATRGGGVTLNRSPLHTSGVEKLEAAIISFDLPRDPALRQQQWTYAETLLKHVTTMRCLGSAVLNIAYVAAGWTDLYMHLTIKPWDQAAAGLMVLEAGGAMATVSGAPWSPFCPDPLALASAALLPQFNDLM